MTNGFFGDQITLKRRHSAVLELDKNFRNEKPLSDDVDNDSFVRSLSEPSIDAHPEQHQKIAQPTDSKLGSLDALQKPLPPTPTQAAEYANHEDIINLYRTTSATSHSDISIPTPNPDIHADTFNLRRGGSAMSIAMSIKTSPTQDKSPEPTQNPNRSVNADTFSTPTFPKFEFPNPQKLSQSSLFQDPTTPTKFPVDFGFTASSFTLDRPAPLDLTSAASSNSLSKELPPKPRSYDINSMSDGELLGIQKVAKIDLETLLQISVPDEEANVETAHAKGNRFGAFFQKFTQNWKPTKEFTGERVELKPSDSVL
ncbi:hypothetical protein BKA69DRAFT_320582 [Paraphysoderma sedebokerense]|nr:hypothetical protein BKA69DRAFT_320582 [Paraphysoderma sedebokerense]